MSAAPTSVLVADGRQLIDVSTSVITDRFGNRLPDGHLVQLRTDGPDGLGIATSTTIDGVARFRLLAPSRPGVVSIAATVGQVTSEPIDLDFGAAVSVIPADVERNADGSGVVSVGPVLDELGAVVADGTPVIVAISGSDEAIEVPLRNGRVTVEVARLGDVVDVEVLGVIRTVTE